MDAKMDDIDAIDDTSGICQTKIWLVDRKILFDKFPYFQTSPNSTFQVWTRLIKLQELSRQKIIKHVETKTSDA